MKQASIALGLLSAITGGLSLQTRQSPVVEIGVQVEIGFGQGNLPLEDVRLTTGAGNTISISRLSMLLSDFELTKSDGSKVRLANQHGWISASDRRLRFRLTDVSVGDYKSLSFKVGLIPKINHSDPATYDADHPLNPSVSNLHWGWAGGYVFLAVEGRYEQPGSRLGGYSFHLGNDENLTALTFSEPFSVTIGTEVRLRFDAARLFRGISISQGKDTSHSATGDPIAAKMKANLPTTFRLISIDQEPLRGELDHVPEVAPPPGTTRYQLKIPAHFPRPTLPPDNPLTQEGVELGRMLFNEKMLSEGNRQACMSCHAPTAAFSDRGQARSKGANGLTGNRNSMPLFNLAWSPTYTWDGRRTRLRDQVLAPIQDAKEMNQSLAESLSKLKASGRYAKPFERAFGDPEINAERLSLAVEQFLLTIISADSKFDRALKRKATFSDQEKRGLELFITEFNPARGLYGADCFHCHGGNLFSDFQFKNNGLKESSDDFGRSTVTGRRQDRSKFKVPSLRNVAVTGPYMHDGRFKTLGQTVEHYLSGVSLSDTLDPNLAKHPDQGIPLNASDKRALIAFLRTLTDSAYSPMP